MQVGGVSLDLTLIMHEQAFGDYLTDHSFLSLQSVGWRTGYYISRYNFFVYLDSNSQNCNIDAQDFLERTLNSPPSSIMS